MGRPDWHVYFMEIATVVATRSTCDRRHVGAVIVRDKTILSTGYNGAPAGFPECDGVGHQLVDVGGRPSCIRTAHAEANAIAQAARNGVAVEGATVYTTSSPCYECMKLIVNSGIKHVVFGEEYDSRGGLSKTACDLMLSVGITVLSLQNGKAPTT